MPRPDASPDVAVGGRHDELPRVLLVDCGRREMGELAEALARRGALEACYSASPGQRHHPARHAPLHRGLDAIAAAAPVAYWPLASAGRWLTRLPAPLCMLSRRAVAAGFSRWAAVAVASRSAELLVASPGAGAAVFAAARRRGLAIVLDATGEDGPGTVGPEFADAVLVASAMAREACHARGWPEARVARLPPVVDLERFRPRAGLPPDGPFRFLVVGGDPRQDDFGAVLAALAGIVTEHPRTVLEYLGTPEPVPAVLAPHVRGHGRPPLAARAALLAECDAMLLLPGTANGGTTALLEALASGVPVLALSGPDTRALLRPGHCGVLVEHRDAAALAVAMRWMVEHRDTLAGWRPACRATALGYGYAERGRAASVALARLHRAVRASVA